MEQAVIDPVSRARIQKALLDPCVPDPSGRMCVYAMAGIPGAGKSTFVARALLMRDFPEGAFILNPDRVMEQLPAYHADRDAIGPEDAFLKWEMPCRTLAYELGYEAAQKRLPIIKDMGLVRSENWRILMELRARGYQIILHHIVCDVEEAVRRCAERERHFPASRIYERARELDALMVDFAGVADVVVTYDNSDIKRPFVLMPSQKSHATYLKTA